MPTRMSEIALKSKVSTATVSRVLNGSSKVSSKTKERVLKVINELNYKPNLVARSLIKNKTNVLGLIVPTNASVFSAYYFNEILSGINASAEVSGYDLLFHVDRSERNTNYLELVETRKVDGILIFAPLLDGDGMAELLERKTPAVLINSSYAGLSIVDTDNVSGAISAVEHLITLGHRRIGHIAGIINGLNGQDRLKGYQLALAKYRIPLDEELIIYGNFEQQRGYEAMKKLLEMSNRPTAVFAGNDLMAIGAIKAINENGLNVPDDIAIVGFDNIDFSSYINPPLTTVKQPLFEIGLEATRLLIEIINGNITAPQKIVLKTELIVRKSSGVHMEKVLV